MDVFAHVLWTNALFHFKYHRQRRLRYLAAFFGVAPDLVSFIPAFLYFVLSGKIFSQSAMVLFGSHNWTLKYAIISYEFSHSLVIFVFCTLLVTIIGNWYLRSKNGALHQFWFFWPILGWGLHILIDIPSHKGFYETPFLFPLSGYHFPYGVPWANPTYMAINYGLLILSYIGLFVYQKYGKRKVSR